MPTEVDASDWGELESWWDAYTQIRSVARNSTERILDTERMTDAWVDLDPWWHAYADTSPHVRAPATMRSLAGKPLTDSWDELDSWWSVYTETGHETAVEVADLLERSNEKWRQSAGPFNTDPLAADLTLERLSRGPLQPTNEVGWSRWLARILRPSEELVAELFDVEADRPPAEVVREKQLAEQDEQDGTSRRPDILVLYGDRGVSIEVKLGDENYRKTAKTASLVEHHYEGREWTHAILLPERKSGRLGSIVKPPVSPRSDGRPQIEWDEPGPVTVLHWCDVTAAIRSLLLWGEIVDDHWAANAYLFCAVAEQRLMGFQPQPVVEQLADPADVVDTIQPIRLADTLEEQLTYLRSGLEP